jgi:hypothetical protein
MRQVMLSQFAILDGLQPNSIAAQQYTDPKENVQDEALFDNLDDPIESNTIPVTADTEAADTNLDTSTSSEIIPPEKRRIPLPSRWVSNKNSYRQVELNLRLQQAARVLSSLRDLIAEKSFQFSHVIRVAPRKGVKTRARSVIAKINNHIGYHCRVYNTCRGAMIKLGADENTLSRFRNLQRQDIASSGALLNPNEPGSSSHRLSWIWQSGRSTDDPNSIGLHECRCSKQCQVNMKLIL